ncbi:VWA domain-containing protein [Nocardioides gilvus]|uniref:VWA domain-containing protein n=1 Tax=Nocardioides gilvus TaxID=1735589 RepID=UPI000D74EA5F|nr:VWA domain-containing protein [Nocardioides gilvus]
MSAPAPQAPSLRDVGPLLVVALVSRLRAGGVPVSTSEVLDAMAALLLSDLTSRRRVRAALRATLVKDASHDVLFRRSFDAVLPPIRADPVDPAETATITSGGDAQVEEEQLQESVVRALREDDEDDIEHALEEAITRFSGNHDDGRSAGHHAQRVLRRMNVSDLYRRYLDADADAEDSDFDRVVDAVEARTAMEQMSRRLTEMLSGRLREGDGVSAQHLEDLQDRPLLRAGADELVAMRMAMRPLARHLAAKLGSSRRRGGSGVDMRRTIRASMGYGGVPVVPVLRRRRPTKPDLVVLCDVSGSTAQFAPFTLTLLHALHDEFRRVRSFVFIDGIVEITELMETSPGVIDPHHLLGARGLIAHDGRSDYARAMTTFLATWGSSVTAKTTVIVAGDARSHDREPATAAVAELSHLARRLYWLNPEPRADWDTLDSRAGEYATHCTDAFEVSTIRQLTAAVAKIV